LVLLRPVNRDSYMRAKYILYRQKNRYIRDDLKADWLVSWLLL